MMESVNRLYSIYDTAAKRYGPIFEAVNDEVAARNYAGVLKTQIPEHYHSEYKLMFLGSYDFVSGEIQQLTAPVEVFVTVVKKTSEIKKPGSVYPLEDGDISYRPGEKRKEIDKALDAQEKFYVRGKK